MKSSLHYLMAARRCEIVELRQLALTGALVNVTGRLIHALQRERGLSNLLLASHGGGFEPQLARQTAECEQVQDELRECFDQLDTDPAQVGNGARLFSRMAYVLQGLDALPALRARVTGLELTPQRATQAFVRLIAGLLAVVFEAADSATDPQISRLLVARFNFMQGKEFAGQERALGAALFASGQGSAREQVRLLHLIESQERCFQVFVDFCSAGPAAAWAAAQYSPALAEQERMRRMLATAADGAPLDAALSRPWFDCCTQRIDNMKQVEDELARELLLTCQARISQAKEELARIQLLAASTPHDAAGPAFFDADLSPASPGGPADMAAAPASAAPLGSHMERSVLDMVQEQAQRLQAMRDELDTVRASLNERKLIERAKGLLMAHRNLSEDDAHKTLRQMAMNQNKRLIEVAQALLSMAEVLPHRPRA